MKNFYSLLFFSFIALYGFSQAPQKFSYQTVVRNASNQLLVGQTVGIKISILQGSANGSAVYSETHTPQTNANGLATLEIGGGSLLSGNFANINWANGPFFVKTETDPNGGNNYTITNTSQLLSVPYALYAASAGNNTPGPQGPAGQNGANGQNGLSAYQIWLNSGNSGSEADFLASLQGPQGNPATDDQNLSVSLTGDTLYLQNGGFVIIPGISSANIPVGSHTCGATNVHNPAKIYGTMTDQEGNVYKTIVIGSQEWMAENLKTSTYRNGNNIPNITNSLWFSLNNGAFCNYNNETTGECPLGKLYNWYAVVDSRNLCPTGWHIPTNQEWNNLIGELDPNSNTIANVVQSTIAGGKLKSTETNNWISPNVSPNNESGFSGLGGGGRYFNGYFDIGNYGIWWSSTSVDSGSAWSRFLYHNNGDIAKSSNLKQDGFSVRCLRD
jgi:uncharacterized protein (TIGR02145 family)